MEPENENTPPDPKSDLHTASTGWFRSKSDVNQDLPIEQFRRLIGLYYSIPEKTRYSEKYLSVSKAFEHLRDVIEQTLGASDKDQASIDKIKFIKYDLGDYVHNLNLLLIGVIQLGFLESNIGNIREEYRGHVDELTYKSFIDSCMHKYIVEKACAGLNDQEFEKYEDNLRLEYRNLTNEIRRARLFEAHIEHTRSDLMTRAAWSYVYTISAPVVLLLTHIVFLCVHTCFICLHIPIELVLFSMAAISGATGSLLSVLLRIQGVQDNNKLAQNIVTFQLSYNAVVIAPLTGFIFAIVIGFMFGGGLVSGALFPKVDGSWSKILCDASELSKWLIWAFIAGFSERLVPDIIDRLSDKAKKGEKT